MTVIRTRVMVAQDHSLSGQAPEFVPAGAYEAIVTFAEVAAPPRFFRSADPKENQ
jgi:hypothetical protein